MLLGWLPGYTRFEDKEGMPPSDGASAVCGTHGLGGLPVRLASVLAIAVVFTTFPAAAQQIDGENLFQQRCGSCHSLDPSRNSTAPNLSGVLGRIAGSVEGASYSEAMRQSEIVWSTETLDSFLAAPVQALPGTRMTMGLTNAEQRAAIIHYLQDQPSDQGANQ